MTVRPIQARLAIWALVLCALASSGCAGLHTPCIDPSGQRLFAPCGIRYRPEPGPQNHKNDLCVSLQPSQVIAPVGAEVAMVAGVCGTGGYLMAGERVEWMLDSGGVGHFVDVGDSMWDCLHLPGNRSRKIDNSYAVGRTVAKNLLLNRGTPTPDDDVPVLAGQSWVTVSSLQEGVSHVTAFAPDVYGWDARRRTAQIHWVDAVWAFPPPAVNPVGTRHVFTTTVARQSDQTPIEGWRVRYEIVGGPPAAFSPEGGQVKEVTTDDLGHASVEIYQTEPTPGVNTVNVRIVRPVLAGRSDRSLTIAAATTQKTWTAPTVSLRKFGPAQASVGATAVYRIELNNPGATTVRDLVVTEQIPPGMTHLSSTPSATVAAGRLEWRLPELGPQQQSVIEIQLRADQPGTFNVCGSVAGPGGVAAQDCVTTTVLVPSLDVTMVGPERARVGDEVTFEVTVTNRGDLPATNLLVLDRYDAGFSHTTGANPIERDLEDLSPGASHRIGVTLRVDQPGSLCNEVQITGDGGIRSSARTCLTAEAAPATPPPATQPTPPAADPPQRQASLSVQKTGPDVQAVGQIAEFNITVTNTGPVRVNDLRVIDSYDRALNPIQATDGFAFAGDDIIWRIDGLDPGRSATLQVHCRCTLAAPRACNRVTVTTTEGARADDEACFEIRGGQGGLTMTVSDVRDPVAVGGETSYEILVRNDGQVADRQVTVVAVVPPEMTPIAVGTTGPTQPTIQGRTVNFRPAGEIRPGETLRYSVQVRADGPGSPRLSVTLSSAGRPQPLTVEESTVIFAQ